MGAARRLALALLLAAAGTSQVVERWDTLASDDLRFVHVPAQRRLAEQLARSAARQGPLPGLPPAPSDTAPITIVLAPRPEVFDSLTGYRVPGWSSGVAYPASGLIILPAFAEGRGEPAALRRTLRHELAHVRLHRFLDPAPIPRWFDEGYARFAAGEWTPEAAWQLRLAFALHRVPPLDSLALGFPAREVDARLAYMLGTTAIQYLYEESGEPGLRRLFIEWRETGNFDQALRRTYGVTLSQLEEEWRRFVQRRYGWAAFLSNAVVFWFFVTIALVLLWRRRARRTRAKLEMLQATELPERPAFWLGEGEAAEEGEGRVGE